MKTIIVAVLVGAIVGSSSMFLLSRIFPPSQNDLIKAFYDTENAVHVSPHSLRTKMSKGQTEDFVLVDLRSQEEYEKAHIVTAISIPAYKDPNTSAYDEKDRIIGSFRKIMNENPGKDVMVYCYSIPCMTGRKIGKMLAEKDIFVKHLGIGWNEWRYFWNLWNHDGEAPTTVEDYVVSGKEPGRPKVMEFPSPCGEGEFGC